jgi:hypothetical protein
LVAILALKLNFGGVLTYDKVFTKIVWEESLSYKCCYGEAFVFCYTKGVSFGEDKISTIGFESLSPKGFPIWVFFQRLNVGFCV